MASRQSNHDPQTTAPIRDVRGHHYRYLGQLQYEGSESGPGLLYGSCKVGLFSGVGVRLYQDVESQCQFLCVAVNGTGKPMLATSRWRYRPPASNLSPSSAILPIFGSRLT